MAFQQTLPLEAHGTPDRGRLIVVEGPDGSGKTTLTEKLAVELGQKRPVVQPREPGGTELGEHLRLILKGQALPDASINDRAEALLFCAARAQIVDEVIKPALARGDWVLLDRFELSTLVYQGYARGLGVDAVATISQFATGGLRPDIVLSLKVSDDTASRRMVRRDGSQVDRIEATGGNFTERVRDGYAQLKKWEPELVVEISAEGDPDEVLAEALAALSELQ